MRPPDQAVDRMEAAVAAAAALAEETRGLGRPGRPVNRRSPFLVGMAGAAVIPPLTAQATALANHLPHYMDSRPDHNSQLGRLNVRFHIQQRLTRPLSTKGSALIGGVLGAGELVLSTVSSMLVVAVSVVYFLVSMPRIRRFAYRLAPQSRRARVILIGDEIFTKVGGYVLGNLLTSVVAGLGTYAWMLAFGGPYPVLLALLVALAVSLPVAIGILVFYIGYRLAEDHLLVPRSIGRTVQVPGVVSGVAVLMGGALMGIIGALIAIPAAAGLRLLPHEVAFHRLDSS